jgi:hypothetical protein
MTCPRNHSDPQDRPSNRHIATCYSAYETYWDRGGLVSEEEFDTQPASERLADIDHHLGPNEDDRCYQ